MSHRRRMFQLLMQRPGINEEIETAINEVFTKRRTLLIVGNCWVDYRGRASSKLQPGERIVIVKEDGALMVHRPIGYEAVNWQPPGCILSAHVSNGILTIRAVRAKPPESVKIHFDVIHLLYAARLEDVGEFMLHASERDMQRAVLLKPSILESNFKPISFEKKVDPGFVDVYGVDREGRLIVIEIKRNPAGREAALQLSRYVEAVRDLTKREVRGILAAPTLKKGTQILLSNLGLTFKSLDPKKCAEIINSSETRKLSDYFQDYS